MITRTLFFAALLTASPALAWSDLEAMELASSLGSVIGSEEACGLAYDQDAIARFIDKNVPADDMSFASALNMMSSGTQYTLQSMTASEKTAHCRQTERTARAHGFIE